MRKLGADVEPAANEVVRKVAVVASQTLIMATPVDTGRARANWQLSIDTEITSELDSTNVQGALARNEATARGYRGGAIIVQNNVKYIGALNAGSSSQAPAGFVERALQAAARAVTKSKVIK